MDVAALFSGGKDSTYASYMARKHGYQIKCLITIVSKNPESFMFHTPAIELTKKQAELMGIPILIKETKGEKELELDDLKIAIKEAIKKYKIKGIVTGAIESVYQSSRIQNICNDLKIECFNPLWQKNQLELLEELLKNNFEIILSGVSAYPFSKEFVGRKIDKRFVAEMKLLSQKYFINPAAEGGEFETLVLNCPLFKKKLCIKLTSILGENYSYRGLFE